MGTNKQAVSVIVVAAWLCLVGCSGPPTAMSVCERLAKEGIGTACRIGATGGIAADALERVEFDLPSVPGKGGQVLLFTSESQYLAAAEGFEKVRGLTGTHRYGNQAKRVYVQFNNEAPYELGIKARKIVAGL